MTDEYNKWIREELVNPVNMFIIILNSLFFVVILVLFFWLILSYTFENIVLDKVDIITLMAKNDPDVYNSIELYVASTNYNKLKNDAENEKKSRDIKNKELLKKEISWWFIVLGLMTFASFIYLIYKSKTQPVTTGEIILIFLIVISFFAELVIYYGLVVPWKFIGDYDMLQAFY